MYQHTAVFNGREYRRRSEHVYPHASRTEGGKVRFHATYAAARIAAGRFGEVVPTEISPKPAPAWDRSPRHGGWGNHV